MIWRFLLRLPENRESYESMLQMGLHAQIRDFRRKFPLKSDSLSRSMEKYSTDVNLFKNIVNSGTLVAHF